MTQYYGVYVAYGHDCKLVTSKIQEYDRKRRQEVLHSKAFLIIKTSRN